MEFSIQDAQNYAIEHNYDIKNARLSIKVADKQRWEVTAAGLPQIEATAQYMKYIDLPTQLIPGEAFGAPAGTLLEANFGLPHNANYGISVSQLIFSGSYLVGLRASTIYQQLSKLSAHSTEQNVRETIAQTCYLILTAEENRRVLQQSYENLQKTHTEISAMFKEGFVEETDVKQLRISLSGLENSIFTLDRQVEISYQLLKMQLGVDFQTEVALNENLTDQLKKINIESRLDREFVLAENVSFRLLKTQEKLADLNVKNEMVSFLPSFAAFAQTSQNAMRLEFNIFDGAEKWYPTTLVGVEMTWPIFSGGAKVFRMQKAKAELQQAELSRKQAEQGLQLSYNQARLGLQSAHKKFSNTQESRNLAKDIYEINLIKYKEGIVSSLDLIQSHNQYLQSESEYLNAVSEVLNAQNTLDKLLDSE